MRKNIFGYNVNILNYSNFEGLDEELQFYNSDANNYQKKINIILKKEINFDYMSKNPSIIYVDDKGFMMISPLKIRWDLSELKDDIINVDLEVKDIKSFKNTILKFISVGFEKTTEALGQILHELVLIPATFFFKDKIIIHGSCLYNKKYDKSVIFGGTGGVGKTSSLIEMGKDHNWVFLSDDIVVVDVKGKIYPNYAYPKIYAYNTIGDKNFEKEILKYKPLMNKIQWSFWKKINPARVRRRISPDLLYNCEYVSPKLYNNLYLFRGKFNEDISFEKISSKSSAIFEKNIILSEYESVYKFIKWYEYNAKALGLEPRITFDEIVKNYEEKYNEIFSNADNYVVKIDDSLDHNIFKKEMIKQTTLLIKE